MNIFTKVVGNLDEVVTKLTEVSNSLDEVADI